MELSSIYKVILLIVSLIIGVSAHIIYLRQSTSPLVKEIAQDVEEISEEVIKDESGMDIRSFTDMVSTPQSPQMHQI
jgi:hypothetical protein